MSKASKESKVLTRKNVANVERMKEVLDDIPNTDVIDSNVDSVPLIPIESNSAESAEALSSKEEVKPKKKAPMNKRAYQYDECKRIIEMINGGKSLDEIHLATKRPVLNLMYKFFNPKRGVKMCRDVEELKKFFTVEKAPV